MFEVQLFGNEFIMISTDKQFSARSFPVWRSPGFELGSRKSKNKHGNYPSWTYIISAIKVRKGDWHFRREKFHGKQVTQSCLVSPDIL